MAFKSSKENLVGIPASSQEPTSINSRCPKKHIVSSNSTLIARNDLKYSTAIINPLICANKNTRTVSFFFLPIAYFFNCLFSLLFFVASALPIYDIVHWAHAVEAKVLVDACKSVPHMAVDVQRLDADFLVASSHKMCGPTGIGFLYGKSDLLFAMPPFLGGGEMISDVFLDHSTFAEPPSRFEAGTPAIGEAIGLGAEIDYLSAIGMQKISALSKVDLANYLYESLRSVPGVHVYGPAPSKTVFRAALCSFNVENIHPTDIATFLDQQVRGSGHHCAQPLHRCLGVSASARASLHFYNTKEDVDAFIHALVDTINFFSSFK
ncbi:hypothetical protein PVL29_007890 [Vitis rotundifolia]|uniref:Aminotransferase class V domain-containing protein n=1 Tax=Vitis rotundifolia TaxID=103349 RepID=A0AA39DW13_VITRO|nr:hypothetical protein PVL29_007890 [Vitis rotundifolia]